MYRCLICLSEESSCVLLKQTFSDFDKGNMFSVCLRRILDIRWYHRVSNWEVRHLTEQPLLTSIIQKRTLMLFGHLIRMDESADARRILTAVPQSDWRRPVGRPHSSWMATLKNNLSLHNLTLEDAIEMALDKPLWGLLAASGATHWQTDRWPRPIVWPIRTWWQFSVSDLPLVVIYWTSTWFIQFAKISAMQWFKKMGDLQKPVVDVTNSLMEEKLRGDCNCVNNFCCSTVYMIIDCMYLL